MRQAIVYSHAEQTVERYLPSNYHIVDHVEAGLLIEGEDSRGWTLDDYVIPRLLSGLIRAEEVEVDAS